MNPKTKKKVNNNAIKVKSTAGKKSKSAVARLKQKYHLFKAALQKGNNKLHLLMKGICDFKELKTYLGHIGKEKAIKFAKSVNNQGVLPIEEAFRSSSTQAVRKELMKLTATDTFRPPHELIDEKQILKKFKQKANSRLGRNLKLACAAVNRVRQHKLRSSSHPSANQLSVTEFAKICADIKKVRATSLNDSLFSAFLHEPSPEERFNHLHERNQRVIALNAGNCLEQADLALEYIREMNYQVRAENFEIRNGDHVFTVIDRNWKSDDHDYLSWGSQAVVCDPWKGEVYPASAIPEQLGDYKRIKPVSENKDYAVAIRFNPDYHRLRSEDELPRLNP